MAGDNINQVGKYLKKTNRDTNYALKRYKPDVPRIERVRDIFDPTNSFDMSFDVKRGESQVLLDLQFNKPPPIANCNSDCLNAVCETFNLIAGTHFITVEHPYTVHSIRVFDNNVFVDPSNIDETDPGAGQFSVQGITGNGPVVVCYTYQEGNCDFDDSPCPDGPSNLHIGLVPIFTDRMDRGQPIPSLSTSTGNVDQNVPATGGCGYWRYFGSLREGHFTNNNVNGDQWEFLLSGTLTSASTGFNVTAVSNVYVTDAFSGQVGGYSALFQKDSDSTHLRIGFNYRYNFQASDGFGGLLPFTGLNAIAQSTKVITTSKFVEWFTGNTNPVAFFARFAQVDPGGWYAKIWKQSEEEPDDWDIIAQYIDVAPVVNRFNIEDAYIALAGFSLSQTSVVDAITVYGAPGQGRSLSRAGSLSLPAQSGNRYQLSYCRSAPDDLVRFGFCDEYATTLIEIDTGPLTDSTQENPSAQVGFSWPSFVDGPGAITGGTQTTARYMVADNPISIRVKGQVQCTNYLDREFGISFYSFGPDAPTYIPEVLLGNIVGSAFTNSEWVDFDITVPASLGADGYYHYQWGVGFTISPDSIVPTLPRYEPPFLFANNTPLTISTRGIEVFSNGSPACQTQPFCPDSFENFQLRGCVEIHDQIFGSVDYFCVDTESTTTRRYFEWEVENAVVATLRGQGVAFDNTDGELKISFRANGTGLTSGTRCKRANTVFSSEGTSETSASVEITYPSPFNCVDNAESYVEMLVSDIPPAWVSTGSLTRTPSIEIGIGGQNDGPEIFYNFDSTGTTNLVIFNTLGNSSFSEAFSKNTWYSIRLRVVDKILYLKRWITTLPEPGNWDHVLSVTNLSNIDGWGLHLAVGEFKDDSMFVKFRNLSVVEIPSI